MSLTDLFISDSMLSQTKNNENIEYAGQATTEYFIVVKEGDRFDFVAEYDP